MNRGDNEPHYHYNLYDGVTRIPMGDPLFTEDGELNLPPDPRLPQTQLHQNYRHHRPSIVSQLTGAFRPKGHRKKRDRSTSSRRSTDIIAQWGHSKRIERVERGEKDLASALKVAEMLLLDS